MISNLLSNLFINSIVNFSISDMFSHMNRSFVTMGIISIIIPDSFLFMKSCPMPSDLSIFICSNIHYSISLTHWRPASLIPYGCFTVTVSYHFYISPGGRTYTTVVIGPLWIYDTSMSTHSNLNPLLVLRDITNRTTSNWAVALSFSMIPFTRSRFQWGKLVPSFFSSRVIKTFVWKQSESLSLQMIMERPFP